MTVRKDAIGRRVGKRKHNGRALTDLQESAVLVKGPSELLERMAAIARERGHPIRRVWREAAELYLTHH